MTFSEIAADHLVYMGYATKGFYASLKKFLSTRLDEEDLEYVLDFSFIPDAFKIIEKEDGDIIEIIEIEDTNPISMPKMTKIVDLWVKLDYFYVSLDLHVMDRYGSLKRRIDLVHYFYAFLKQNN